MVTLKVNGIEISRMTRVLSRNRTIPIMSVAADRGASLAHALGGMASDLEPYTI
jgi:hypothetical protein